MKSKPWPRSKLPLGIYEWLSSCRKQEQVASAHWRLCNKAVLRLPKLSVIWGANSRKGARMILFRLFAILLELTIWVGAALALIYGFHWIRAYFQRVSEPARVPCP